MFTRRLFVYLGLNKKKELAKNENQKMLINLQTIIFYEFCLDNLKIKKIDFGDFIILF